MTRSLQAWQVRPVVLRLSLAAAMAGAVADGATAGLPCPSPGSCFASHSTPGCDIHYCCLAVCEEDPFCCDVQWDDFCVLGAKLLCVGCGGPGTGYCWSAHPTPWCNDAVCCNLVCAQDPFCCDVAWDSFCVGNFDLMCICGGALTGDCLTVHPTPMCNDAECCDQVCFFDEYCCSVEWDDSCVASATARCTCGGSATGSCFASHAHPFCFREACCEAVCADDPFCCDQQWDNFCVGGAYIACCPADVYPFPDGDGAVGINDLLMVLGAWGGGFCAPEWGCPDVSPQGGDGQVGVNDLLYVIGGWGPCK